MASEERTDLWQRLELALLELVEVLEARLPSDDSAWIREFVRVNEFGVAFDTLVHKLREHEIALREPEVRTLDDLSLYLDGQGHWLRLRERIDVPGDVPPARDLKLRHAERLLAEIEDAVRGLIHLQRSGTQVGVDAFEDPPYWLGALERIVQIEVHGQPDFMDAAAWLDGTNPTVLTVTDEDAVVVECNHVYVSGQSEWLKTPARYELRLPPGTCTGCYGGRAWARHFDDTSDPDLPNAPSEWSWQLDFSLDRTRYRRDWERRAQR
jgi:hypothetical protein